MKKVLVADDKATGRELVRTVLEKSGHQVFEASDGEEAVREACRIHPDPIIALTASAMMGDRERAMSVGFTGYITKPIRLDALRAEVERLLA
jgi:CheY-like chemotaxis protein